MKKFNLIAMARILMLSLLTTVLLLAGCGQRGDLYLPPQEQEKVPKDSPLGKPTKGEQALPE